MLFEIAVDGRKQKGVSIKKIFTLRNEKSLRILGDKKVKNYAEFRATPDVLPIIAKLEAVEQQKRVMPNRTGTNRPDPTNQWDSVLTSTINSEALLDIGNPSTSSTTRSATGGGDTSADESEPEGLNSTTNTIIETGEQKGNTEHDHMETSPANRTNPFMPSTPPPGNNQGNQQFIELIANNPNVQMERGQHSGEAESHHARTQPRHTHGLKFSDALRFVKPYAGKKNKIHLFIRDCEKAFLEVRDEDATSLFRWILSHLEGIEPELIGNREFDAWDDLKAFLNGKFQRKGAFSVTAEIAKYSTLKQGDTESTESYFNRAIEFKRQLEVVNNEDHEEYPLFDAATKTLILKFIHGLRAKELRFHLHQNRPDSLEETLEKIEEYEEIPGNDDVINFTNPIRRINEPQPNCPVCKASNHTLVNCPTAKAIFNVETCLICKKSHHWKQCGELKKAQADNNYSDPNNDFHNQYNYRGQGNPRNPNYNRQNFYNDNYDHQSNGYRHPNNNRQPHDNRRAIEHVPHANNYNNGYQRNNHQQVDSQRTNNNGRAIEYAPNHHIYSLNLGQNYQGTVVPTQNYHLDTSNERAGDRAIHKHPHEQTPIHKNADEIAYRPAAHNNQRAAFVIAEAGGRKIRAQVDTGADASIISETMINKARMIRSDAKLRGVGGRTEVKGKVYLIVKMGELEFASEFLVVEKSALGKLDASIGLDILLREGINLLLYEKLMTQGNKSVKLYHTDDDNHLLTDIQPQLQYQTYMEAHRENFATRQENVEVQRESERSESHPHISEPPFNVNATTKSNNRAAYFRRVTAKKLIDNKAPPNFLVDTNCKTPYLPKRPAYKSNQTPHNFIRKAKAINPGSQNHYEQDKILFKRNFQTENKLRPNQWPLFTKNAILQIT